MPREIKPTNTSGFAVGDEIELLHTDDPYTLLVPGERGWVEQVRVITALGPTYHEIHIRWRSGSRLTLIPEAGDRLRKIGGGSPEGTDRTRKAEEPDGRSSGGPADRFTDSGEGWEVTASVR